jgi:hypothetical protein
LLLRKLFEVSFDACGHGTLDTRISMGQTWDGGTLYTVYYSFLKLESNINVVKCTANRDVSPNPLTLILLHSPALLYLAVITPHINQN